MAKKQEVPGKPVNLFIRLKDADLWKRFKERAKQDGVFVYELLQTAMRRELRRRK